MEVRELSFSERQTINLLANSGMNVSRAAEVLGCSRKTVYDRIRTIKNKTGKDPTDFWDLYSLVTDKGFYQKVEVNADE